MSFGHLLGVEALLRALARFVRLVEVYLDVGWVNLVLVVLNYCQLGWKMECNMQFCGCVVVSASKSRCFIVGVT